MTSAPIRSVAADSNVLLSALAGQAARRVFKKASGLVVVSTLHNRNEIEEYVPQFAARYGLGQDLLLDALELLPVEFHSETNYIGQLAEARALLEARDPDDVALAALALSLKIPIWSNDRDYEGFPFGVFTTAQLLKILGV